MDFKKLFSEQSAVKVVLNGGKGELEDSTIPFTIGFNEQIAEQKPTHVLVIDIPYVNYKTDTSDNPLDVFLVCNGGERKIYELTKVDFIQFHKPGKHNLIFVLLSNPKKEDIHYISQKRSLSSLAYENPINEKVLSDAEEVVGYCEELVEIPAEFFAALPKTKLKIWWHRWVNRWYDYEPVDQCAFRKRVPLAVSVQLIVWVIGFLLRFILTLILDLMVFILTIPCFIFGSQVKKVFFKEIFKTGWKFVFLSRKYDRGKMFAPIEILFDEDNYNDSKCYKFGKQEIKLPISLGGLAVQFILWSLFSLLVHSLFTQVGYWTCIRSFVIAIIVNVFALIHLQSFVFHNSPFDRVRAWHKSRFYSIDNAQGEKIINPFLVKLIIGLVLMYGVLFLALNVNQIIYNFNDISIFFSNVGKSLTFSRIKFILTCIVIVVFVWNFKFICKYLALAFDWFFRWIWKIVIGIFSVVFVFLWSLFSKRDLKTINTNNTIKQKQVVLSRTDWLKENMSIDKLPKKVEFDNLVAPTKIETIYLKFKTKFYLTKTKVCRPYEK